MAFAEGSQHGLYSIPEVAFNTTPASPDWDVIRHTSCSLNLKRDSFESKEIRADRAVTALRLGNRKVEGDIGFELSYTCFNEFLEALLGGTWAVAYNLTSQSIAVTASTKKFSRATGSFITDGVEVGDYITTTGFAETGNNGTFLVSNVAALEVTCSTATGLVDEAAGGNETMTTSRYELRQGTTLRSFSILRRFSDITQYFCFSGCSIGKMTLSVKPNAMITGVFSVVGADLSAALPGSSTYNAATTYDPMDSFSGAILEGGSAIAVVSALDLTLDNGLQAEYVIGDDNPPQLTWKRSRLTGKLTAYVEDLTYFNKFLNETASSLKFTASDGTRDLVFYMDNIKYTTGDLPAADEGPVMLDLNFTALHDTTYTNLQIDRNPGA